MKIRGCFRGMTSSSIAKVINRSELRQMFRFGARFTSSPGLMQISFVALLNFRSCGKTLPLPPFEIPFEILLVLWRAHVVTLETLSLIFGVYASYAPSRTLYLRPSFLSLRVKGLDQALVLAHILPCASPNET